MDGMYHKNGSSAKAVTSKRLDLRPPTLPSSCAMGISFSRSGSLPNQTVTRPFSSAEASPSRTCLTCCAYVSVPPKTVKTYCRLLSTQTVYDFEYLPRRKSDSCQTMWLFSASLRIIWKSKGSLQTGRGEESSAYAAAQYLYREYETYTGATVSMVMGTQFAGSTSKA